MDFISVLPSEIAHAIFLEAVQVRGVNRAGRLRLVCRSWNAAVMDAMFKSGILDTEFPTIREAPYWPHYLTYRILHTNKPLPRGILIVRQVAARVLASRGQDPSDDALESYILEICSVLPILTTYGGDNYNWLQVPSKMEIETSNGIIDETDHDYKKVLLCAAACTNDVTIVAEVLPHIQDCLYLLCQNGREDPYPIFAYPIDVAAYKGNLEVLTLLVETIAAFDPSQIAIAMGQIALSATEGNQLEVLKRYPQSFCQIDSALGHCLAVNTSVEVFGWLSNTAITLRPRHKDYRKRTRGFRNQLTEAIRRGATALMEHFCESDPYGPWREDFGKETSNLISIAAKANNEYAVEYLTEKGLPIGTSALENASKHGNIRMIKLLLARCSPSQDVLKNSLLYAVRREHEPVFRLLMEFGTIMDKNLRSEALLVAEKDGLDSMSRLIKSY